jgi:succinoglycan biosynthesis transport protein ExoP
MDAIRSPIETNNPAPAAQPAAGPDLLKLLWRWKWLPILGAAIGMAISYLAYSQALPQYRATALVQVETRKKNIPMENNNGNGPTDMGSPINDELVLIKSLAVLQRAIDLGKFHSHRRLASMSPEKLIKYLKKNITTKLGSTDPQTTVVSISVTTDEAELSGFILQALLSGYKDHTSMRLKSSTSEVLGVLAKYRDNYEAKKEAVEKELANLRNHSDLRWIEGKPVDPASTKLISIEKTLQELESKKKSIESLLEQIAVARENNRPLDELVQLITSSTENQSKLEEIGLMSDQADLREMRSDLANFEYMVVTPVRVDLANAKAAHGDLHPQVISNTRRLAGLEAELAAKRAEIEKREGRTVPGENSSAQRDVQAIETTYRTFVSALGDQLQKLDREMLKHTEEIESLRATMQRNAFLIGNFTVKLAELEAIGETSTEVTESLSRLHLSIDYSQKTVTELEASTIGAFVGPRIELFLGIGGLLGCALFGGIAYLLELADRSYRSPDEIATDLGMPIIGHLPLSSMSRNKRIDDKVDNSIVTLHKSRSSLSEAFRGIRTSVFFASQQGSVKVIQVTSPVPGDGKSTIAANMAVSISQAGRRVCLVDCDFRRPRVAKIFGLREDLGLVQVIGEKSTLDEAIQKTSIENMWSLTCGRRPGNPAELLASHQFQTILGELRERFDYVIVDTPPILVVSDPAAVASLVDGVVLTIRLRRNLKPIAIRASQMLHSMNANMLGVVVNGIGVGGNGYGYGGYRYDSYSSGYGAGSAGYGKSGYGGYGYGSTYQYGGYYGGSVIGKDYYADQVPKPVSKA